MNTDLLVFLDSTLLGSTILYPEGFQLAERGTLYHADNTSTNFSSYVYSATGHILAFKKANTVYVIDVNTWTTLFTIASIASFGELSLSRDGTLLAVGTQDDGLHVYLISTQAVVAKLPDSENVQRYRGTFSPTEDRLLVWPSNFVGNMYIFDTTTWSSTVGPVELNYGQSEFSPVYYMDYTPGGTQIIGMANSSTPANLFVLNATTLAEVATLTTPNFLHTKGRSFSPDGQYFVTFDTNTTTRLRIYDFLDSFASKTYTGNALLAAPNSSGAAVAFVDNTHAVVQVTGTKLRILDTAALEVTETNASHLYTQLHRGTSGVTADYLICKDAAFEVYGTVRDEDNTLVERKVFIVRHEDGAVISYTVSDAVTGEYSCPSMRAGPVAVFALDDMPNPLVPLLSSFEAPSRHEE
jgi:hypothetical protein